MIQRAEAIQRAARIHKLYKLGAITPTDKRAMIGQVRVAVGFPAPDICVRCNKPESDPIHAPMTQLEALIDRDTFMPEGWPDGLGKHFFREAQKEIHV